MKLDFSTLGSSLFSGLLIQWAPNIIRGVMKEYLGLVKLKDFAEFVKTNQTLWEKLPPDQQKTLSNIGLRLGRLEWFTKDWLMEEGRTASPTLYSALEDWPEGQEWLERQVEDIKLHITGRESGQNRDASSTRLMP